MYDFLRGATGFALMTGGTSLLLDRSTSRGAPRDLGTLFLAAGALFTLSALDPLLRLPVDLDNLLLVALMYGASRSIGRITFYLFGDERRKGIRKLVSRGELAFSVLLVLLPLLDYAFRLRPSVANVEDRFLRAPFHSASVVLIYLLPGLVLLFSLWLAKWQPADVSTESTNSRRMVVALAVLAGNLALIVVASILGNRTLYRVGHLIVELLVLGLYFYTVRNPSTFAKLRTEIGQRHQSREWLGDGEAEIIAARLAVAAADPGLLLDEELDLAALAKRIGVPAYRLSRYLSSRLDTTFSAWINRLRIDFVCARMAERPDLSILAISVEAGYRSKTAFTNQFTKLKGMTPSQYRRSAPAPGARR